MDGWGKLPLEIRDYDNPETVRARKYATGARLLSAVRLPEVGQTPREVIWEKNRAKVYRYEPARERASVLEPLARYAYSDASKRPYRDKRLETFLAACRWVDDGVPFPGEAFRRWIVDFYQQNRLAKGELELRGRRVDLSNLVCPLLNVAGAKDFICPLSQAEPTMDLVGSDDKDLLVSDAGHVGLMVGPAAKKEVRPRICEWLEPRSR